VILDKGYPSRTIDAKVKLRDLKDPAAGAEMKVDLALQGPKSQDVLLECVDDPSLIHAITELPKTSFIECEVGGIPVLLSRTGYTGEECGYEFYLHPDNLVKMWNLLLEKGEKYGITPCGLAARDSLRTEAGLPLYGHELAGDLNIRPGGAGYSSFVKLHKPFFIGKSPYVADENIRKMSLIRFQIISGGARRLSTGDRILDRRGKVIGQVTICTLTGDGQIGMAYVSNKYKKPGNRLGIIPSPRDESSLSRKVPSELKVGERMVLPEQAQVLSRFMVRRPAQVISTGG